MHKQINQLRANLMAQFPECKDVIDGSLAAVLAGEHVLLIGPPGTAKSALVRCLAQVFGGIYFERLLTKFRAPEELFGPISLQALAQDRFVRYPWSGLSHSNPPWALPDQSHPHAIMPVLLPS
jgi:MoxR-like ATPase